MEDKIIVFPPDEDGLDGALMRGEELLRTVWHAGVEDFLPELLLGQFTVEVLAPQQGGKTNGAEGKPHLILTHDNRVLL
jgi:hypothetical protein